MRGSKSRHIAQIAKNYGEGDVLPGKAEISWERNKSARRSRLKKSKSTSKRQGFSLEQIIYFTVPKKKRIFSNGRLAFEPPPSPY